MGKPVERPDILHKYSKLIQDVTDNDQPYDNELVRIYDLLADQKMRFYLNELLMVLAVVVLVSSLVFVWVTGMYWGLTLPFFYFSFWYIYHYDIKLSMESIADKDVLPDDFQLMINELRKARDIRRKRLYFTLFAYVTFITTLLTMTGFAFFGENMALSIIIITALVLSSAFNYIMFKKEVVHFRHINHMFQKAMQMHQQAQ